MKEVGDGLQSIGTRSHLTVGMIYSLIMWGSFLVAQAYLLDALRINLNTDEALAISAVILVAVPPSSPAMIGVYQSVVVALLAPFNITDTNRLLAYSIVVFAVFAIFWVVTGLWSLTRTHLNVRELINSYRSSSGTADSGTTSSGTADSGTADSGTADSEADEVPLP